MRDRKDGLTLVEFLIVAMLLAIGIVSVLGAYVNQMSLAEYARNLAWASNDAARVMERLRDLNSTNCLVPTVTVPDALCAGQPINNDWDRWLQFCGGGKSVQPTPIVNELIVVRTTGANPLRITVGVCWRQRGRVIGECRWDGVKLVPDDKPPFDGLIASPAAYSASMTCRD